MTATEGLTVATMHMAAAMVTRAGEGDIDERVGHFLVGDIIMDGADDDNERRRALRFRDVAMMSKQDGVRVRRMPLFTL